MNGNSIVREGDRVITFKLLAMGVALFFCSGISAQKNVVVPPKPLKVPDLVISSLGAKLVAPNRVQYSWTITNVRSAPANLNGSNV
jgi:hypothetical protein